MDEDFKRKLIGVTTEVGGGIGTDLATSPLLFLGPKGWIAYGATNAFQGSYTNYQVQKYINPDEKVNWGEVAVSGIFSAIPFMDIPAKAKYAKYLGRPGTLKRAIVGGSVIGPAQQQVLKAYESGEFLTPTEAGFSSIVGGVTGGVLKSGGDKLSKSLLKQVPTGTLSQRTQRKMNQLFDPSLKEKMRARLVKMGVTDPDGNITITELDKRQLGKDRKYWERITERNIARIVREFGGNAADAAAIFAEQKMAWGKQKAAATWLNKYFTALTTELDADGVPINQVVIGVTPQGKIRLVEKGQPNSYPQAFEVDHRRAVQEMRELGIPVGLGANFEDNLETIYAVFNRAKNNIGNPSIPSEFSAALGLSTTLKDMVGKYFGNELSKTNMIIPPMFKDMALRDMLEQLQNQIAGMGTGEGAPVVTPYQVKQWASEIATKQIQYWKNLGPVLINEIERALEDPRILGKTDIALQIEKDRILGTSAPDMRWDELQSTSTFQYLLKSFKNKYRKAAEKFINTRRGLRARPKKKFYIDPND